MKRLNFCFVLIFALVNLGAYMHPFHASITQANLNLETNNLEITVRLFTDDLGAAIGEEILIGKEQTKEQNLKINDYLKPKLNIFPAKGKRLELQEVGQETEFDITFVYFEIQNFPKVKEFEISQIALFDQFDDQTNILNLIIDKETYSNYFTSTSILKTYQLK